MKSRVASSPGLKLWVLNNEDETALLSVTHCSDTAVSFFSANRKVHRFSIHRKNGTRVTSNTEGAFRRESGEGHLLISCSCETNIISQIIGTNSNPQFIQPEMYSHEMISVLSSAAKIYSPHPVLCNAIYLCKGHCIHCKIVVGC